MSARKIIEVLWRPAPHMPAAGRLALLRESRIVAAAAMLALFPLLALASQESAAVIAALLLAALLPAAVALDCRRPARLDRAAALNVVITAAVASAGALRGLPAAAALLMLSFSAIEAFIVSRSSGRARSLGAAAAGAAAVLGAAALADPSALPAGAGLAGSLAVAILSICGSIVLVRGLIRMFGAEMASARHDRLLGSEIESIVSETVLTLDRAGRVSRVGVNAQRVLGLSRASLMGRGLIELTLVADRPLLLTACARALDAPPQAKTRFRLRADAGEAQPRHRWAEIALEPSAVEGLIIGAVRDVSAEVAEEERGRAAAAEAETARVARSAFLSTVSHELRTPLNAIIGFSDILANPATTPADVDRVRDYARIVNGSGQDLLRMVSAMIDMTRMDAGVYEFEAEEQELAPLAESIVEAFRQEPEAAGRSFRVVASAGRLAARVDARALRSALHQLLSNATKFGGDGPVEIRVHAPDGGAAVTVSDRGAGIPADKLALLGARFARLDDGLGRRKGGMGLGLALAHGIMALHGGRLSIESRPGEGTSVTLHLAPAALSGVPANVTPLAARRRPAEARPRQTQTKERKSA